MGKQKGAKKGNAVDDEEKKKKVMVTNKTTTSDDDGDHNDLNVSTSKKKVSRFDLLGVEEGDDVDRGDDDDDDKNDKVDDDEEEEEDSKEKSKAKAGGKKSKKEKRKKKGGDEDDELDAMMAELALEIEGKKPPPKPSEDKSKEPSPEAASDNKQQTTNKKEKTNKSQKAPADEESVGKNLKSEAKPVQQNKVETDKAKTQANENKEVAESEASAPGKGKKKKKGEKATSDVPAKPSDEPAKGDAGATGEAEAEAAPGADADADDEDGAEKTSKKKKGKKDVKEVKKGGPGKKQIAAMQEALRKLQEEEERQRREEEERIRREEEAEEQRLEKLRLEKEKKDRKKQKEKERRERLKKEGKLLTSKQKADMQRAKMSLELLKQQGRIVVGRDKVAKQDSAEDDASKKQLEKDKSVENGSSENVSENVNDEHVSDNEEEGDEVKETWEESSGSEDEEDSSKSESKITTTADSAMKEKPKQLNVTAKTSQVVSREPQTKSSSISQSETLSTDSSKPNLRSPIVCVLGHVDTGKTKLLDYVRRTHVQDNEAGGITQQIGATFVPPTAIHDQCRGIRNPISLDLPGLLIIDTPGHESFTNLRSRGSSLCDIAVLVIDIMHGLEQQTIESINLLKARKTPFIVALNKIDRIYNWKPNPKKDVEDVIKSQHRDSKLQFDELTRNVITGLNEQALNAALYYENADPRSFVSLVPTSAASGDGMGNLIALLVNLTQSMMSKKLIFDPDNLEATVLEVKAIPGLGTTIDVILVNGSLHEGSKIVLAGHDGPIVTQIRSLLVPQPLRELRVKTPYQELKVVKGSMGVKVAGHDLDKAVAGLLLHVAKNESEIERLKTYCWNEFGEAMKAIKCTEKGVYVQASTLGSLEALLEFLKVSKIPYSGVRIGPVVKRDVMRASIMLETSPDYAVILAFDVRIERDAQELADQLGVRIFQAEIIYHLFDKFTAYTEDLKRKRREEYKSVAIFPCKLRILPNFIFNNRDPIVLGVSVEDGLLVSGTPLAVPSKGNLEIGRVTTIEVNHKAVENARRGQEVCIKIEHCGGDAPKMFGRHFDHQDVLVSRITRESIDAVKEYFRDDLIKSDWQLMIELKKSFEIM